MSRATWLRWLPKRRNRPPRCHGMGDDSGEFGGCGCFINNPESVFWLSTRTRLWARRVLYLSPVPDWDTSRPYARPHRRIIAAPPQPSGPLGAADWRRGRCWLPSITDRPAKPQPAACLLPGLDTSGGREWFNPNRVRTKASHTPQSHSGDGPAAHRGDASRSRRSPVRKDIGLGGVTCVAGSLKQPRGECQREG